MTFPVSETLVVKSFLLFCQLSLIDIAARSLAVGSVMIDREPPPMVREWGHVAQVLATAV